MNAPVALNRKARRAKQSRRRTGFAAAAAVTTTAAALTAAVSAPVAAPRVMSNPNIMLAADPISVDVITTGGLFGLVNALGFDTIPINAGPVSATINLNYVKNNGVDLYNAINAVPMQPGGTPANCLLSDNKNGCRVVPVATIGGGATGVRDGLNALWSIALGQQPLPVGNTDYSPLLAGDTAALGALINDTLRPNGGLAARFANATSTVPVTGSTIPCPDGSCADTPNQDKTKAINNLFDLTWEYNPQADFPAVFNLLALTNSFMGNLPPIAELYTLYEQQGAAAIANLIAVTDGVGGVTAPAGSPEATGILIAGLSGDLFGASPSPSPALYATLTTGTLPLFEPNAIAALAVNSLLAKVKAKFIFGTPMADVLTPALTILINTAYPDVLTPEALKANPDLVKLGYEAYDRTFAQEQITFGSVKPLTRQQQKEANVAAWNAFTTSLKEQAQKPFFGIIEPLLQAPGASVKPVSAAAKAAPAAAAAVVDAPAVESAAPVEVREPVAVSLAEDPVADAPAPEAPVQRTGSRHESSSASPAGAGDTPSGRSRHSASRGSR